MVDRLDCDCGFAWVAGAVFVLGCDPGLGGVRTLGGGREYHMVSLSHKVAANCALQILADNI